MRFGVLVQIEKKILATFAPSRFKFCRVAALSLFGVALFGVGVAWGQAQNDAMNPTFDGLTDWTTYGTVSHTLDYDHAGENGSLVLGAVGSGATQTATLQGSGAHVLTVWAKADDANCGLLACLGNACAYAPLGSTDWNKFGVVATFGNAGERQIDLRWYETESCTSTQMVVDDVMLTYSPEVSPTVYNLDDVYTVLDQMRQADETFHTDTGFILDEIHHDIHETRHLATFYTTTFEIAPDEWYQVATIGTYTDGERVTIVCLICLVLLQLYQFMRKELKG